MTVEQKLRMLFSALEVLRYDNPLRIRIESFFRKLLDDQKPEPRVGMPEQELMEIQEIADREIAEFNTLAIAARRFIQ
ncbi:MAG TPA: hypothetical protein VKB79_09515 [Bryobacteraceae bacterium]|nr:hypothetical protein [Bryobacteraceae bacterium]